MDDGPGPASIRARHGHRRAGRAARTGGAGHRTGRGHGPGYRSRGHQATSETRAASRRRRGSGRRLDGRQVPPVRRGEQVHLPVELGAHHAQPAQHHRHDVGIDGHGLPALGAGRAQRPGEGLLGSVEVSHVPGASPGGATAPTRHRSRIAAGSSAQASRSAYEGSRRPLPSPVRTDAHTCRPTEDAVRDSVVRALHEPAHRRHLDRATGELLVGGQQAPIRGADRQVSRVVDTVERELGQIRTARSTATDWLSRSVPSSKAAASRASGHAVRPESISPGLLGRLGDSRCPVPSPRAPA